MLPRDTRVIVAPGSSMSAFNARLGAQCLLCINKAWSTSWAREGGIHPIYFNLGTMSLGMRRVSFATASVPSLGLGCG